GNYDQSPSQQHRFFFTNSPQSISPGGPPLSFTPSSNPNPLDVNPDFLDFTNLSQDSEAGPDGHWAFNPIGLPSFGDGGQGGLNFTEADYFRDPSDAANHNLMEGFWFGNPGANPGA